MHTSTTINDSLKIFISALGGTLDDADINAAASLEGGKELLAWLSQQAVFFLNDEESKQSLDDRIQVILRDVMLEKDEVPLCVSFKDYSRFLGTDFYSPTTVVATLTPNPRMMRWPQIH